MKIFNYIVSEGRIVFNHDEYGYITEFVELLKLDKGSNKDYRGQKKLSANKELGMIWWCHDVRSPGIRNGLTGNELLQDAKDNFKIDKDWKPSVAYGRAEKAYIKYSKSIIKDTYNEIFRSFKLMGNYVAIMRKQFEVVLKNSDVLTTDELTLMGQLFKELMNIGTELPKRLEALLQAEKLLIKEEESDDEIGRSGKKLKDSTNPKKALG